MTRLRTVEDARRLAAWVLPWVTLLWVLSLAWAAWPKFWVFINFEDSPMTNYQTAMFGLAFLVAFWNGFRERQSKAARWLWWAWGLGFLYLGLDEKLMFHERMREQVLKPMGKVSFLPWMEAGDYLPMAYALFGLLQIPLVFKVWRPGMGFLVRLGVAILLTMTAIGLDSIDPDSFGGHGLRYEQFAEEILEGFAGTFFVAAFLTAEPKN